MSDPDYDFDIRVSRPKRWRDRSMYIYEARRADPVTGYLANIVVTKTALSLTQNFKLFVQTEMTRYKTEIDGFELLQHRDGKMNGMQGSDFVFTWQFEFAGTNTDLDNQEPVDPDAGKIMHRVVFLKARRNQAITFTAAAALSDFPKHEAAFNEALASLK